MMENFVIIFLKKKILQYIILMDLLIIQVIFSKENIMGMGNYFLLEITMKMNLYMKVNLKMDFIMDLVKKNNFKINIQNFYMKEIS